MPYRRFAPEDEVVPGVQYGRQEWVPTPAFWAAMADLEGDAVDDYVSPNGTPLAEDLAFCLLGGYGVKMELNRAAWERLHEAGALRANDVPSEADFEALLSEPLLVNGKLQKYRYLGGTVRHVTFGLDDLDSRAQEGVDLLLIGTRCSERELEAAARVGLRPTVVFWPSIEADISRHYFPNAVVTGDYATALYHVMRSPEP